MVKRIKKRVERPESTEEELDSAVGAAELSADIAMGSDGEGQSELESELALAATEDEFTRRTAGMFQWIVNNRIILIGVALVLLAGYGYFLYSSRVKAAGSEQATAAFMEGANAYKAAVAQAGPNEEALDEAARKNQLQKAKAAFDSTKTTYPASGVAKLSDIGLGGTHLELGDPAQALTHYNAVLGDAKLDSLARAVALQGKAAALDSKGDRKGSIAAWQALAAIDNTSFGIMAGMQVARLTEETGDVAGAKQAYESLQKSFTAVLSQPENRGAQAQIERNLARLGGLK